MSQPPFPENHPGPIFLSTVLRQNAGLGGSYSVPAFVRFHCLILLQEGHSLLVLNFEKFQSWLFVSNRPFLMEKNEILTLPVSYGYVTDHPQNIVAYANLLLNYIISWGNALFPTILRDGWVALCPCHTCRGHRYLVQLSPAPTMWALHGQFTWRTRQDSLGFLITWQPHSRETNQKPPRPLNVRPGAKCGGSHL